MILFVVSGLTYVLGAIGLEMIGGLRVDVHGSDDLVYLLIVTCEEFLEMLGIVIFIYALLSYMGEHLKELRIVIELSEENEKASPEGLASFTDINSISRR